MAVVEKTVYNIRDKVSQITREILKELRITDMTDAIAEAFQAASDADSKATEAKEAVDEIKEKIDNIYTKEETDAAITAAIGNVDHLKREIVDILPAKESADTNTIYMVSIEDGDGDQRYDEYMYIDGEFEKIGSSTVDLTDYATKDYVDNATENVLPADRKPNDILVVDEDNNLSWAAHESLVGPKGEKGDSPIFEIDEETGHLFYYYPTN